MLSERTRVAFESHDGVLTAEQAQTQSISREALRKAVGRGDLLWLSHGIYALPDYPIDDMMVDQYRFPRGVFSHESAASLYGYTVATPAFYQMTFPYGYHSESIKRQRIKPFFATPVHYETGRSTMDNWLGNEISVTDREKTLLDVLVAKEIFSDVKQEVLRTYLADPDKNLDRLGQYVNKLNVPTRIRKVLTDAE
ncbi:type IV toxin-antitoxin system AbiEi family antitoxin domain-containing protein [Bifidobacterium tibiigranuli]|uniref:type IV toxin-antitoxin system AbiEi family antitoxin domain-containing protein n=1 Tax=Bifidobacterium tibiigranuli TaxID=2172043 RepID=UPI0026F2B1DD|nr:type IV toxin-antitoxin system AbiEi family antitoxin domain-containing protein [Bifidobacterium tibiigranuli]MCI1650670.1 type IV toxin-antitoxin system AbiEi family antitoxin domain-containing protein [Bifidobacterium tibiigranuli]MCI2185954.1 type IV toxin-antitoxin system AbiEi family antitoxin domain-containing protein [Bifidobacterium tibiigranuli]MCI2204841.1 type IV toxin-antitoxin system AbiEi family antitoxin domain-containing protein [Bifidobacterium tibiigranuli]